MWSNSDDKSFPFKKIFPFGIFCNPAIDLSIVVLPIPEGPNRQIISPSFLIVRLKSKTLFFY